MHTLIRSTLLAALALAPGAALAQMLIEEPAPMSGEAAVIVQQPGMVVEQPMVGQQVIVGGPIGVEDARAIAMMNGIVDVEDVDQRWWDGNFVVEGEDGSGENMEVTIDSETGAVLDIDG